MKDETESESTSGLRRALPVVFYWSEIGVCS